MSAEIFFRESFAFLFVFWGRCSRFWLAFLVLFTFALWCVSAWFVVRFNVGMRGV